MKKLIAGLTLGMILAGAWVGMAQDRREWVGHMFFRILNPQIRYNGTLAFQDFSGNGAAISASGLTTSTAVTSNTIFFPATSACRSDVATQQNGLIPVRVAANDWAISRTAGGAETLNIVCNLQFPWRTTTGKGVRIDSFRIAHQITVANLTSATFNGMATDTFVNNTADSVAAHGGTITVTLPTATQAAPYLTAATVGTPAFMVSANTMVTLDWTAVLANTGVYKVYGVSVSYSTLQ